MQPTNVHLMRGFIQLGRLLRQNTDIKDAMSPEDIFHKYVICSYFIINIYISELD